MRLSERDCIPCPTVDCESKSIPFAREPIEWLPKPLMSEMSLFAVITTQHFPQTVLLPNSILLRTFIDLHQTQPRCLPNLLKTSSSECRRRPRLSERYQG
jgi:hypothetical protein